MKFDNFLSFIFRKGLILIVTLLSTLLIVASFTGCLYHDFWYCFCSVCQCGDCSEICAEVCQEQSIDCDNKLRDAFPDDCAIADILFGSGCETRTDNCSIQCLGCGHEVMTCQRNDFGCGATGCFLTGDCVCEGAFFSCSCGDQLRPPLKK